MLDPTLYEWWAPSLFLKSYVRIEETNSNKPIGLLCNMSKYFTQTVDV
jgi:hypothetical protein